MPQGVFRPKCVEALARREFSFFRGGKKVEKADKINPPSCIVNIRKIIRSLRRQREGGVSPITKQKNGLICPFLKIGLKKKADFDKIKNYGDANKDESSYILHGDKNYVL